MGSSAKKSLNFNKQVFANTGDFAKGGYKDLPGRYKSTPGDRIPDATTQFNSVLTGMENNFLSYDDLVRMGRIAPGTELGFTGGQSRFGRDFAALTNAISASDPILAQYRASLESGLAGLQNGLPDDYRQKLTREVRSAQAARGVIDSDTAAVQEAAQLTGGSEAIRATRLAEVQNYLSGLGGIAINALLPSSGTLLSAQYQSAQLNLQRSMAGAGARNGLLNQALGTAGSLAGIGLGYGLGGGGASIMPLPQRQPYGSYM